MKHLEKKGWVPVVFHGKRTKEQQQEKVKSGASKTMNSFHVGGSHIENFKNGFAFNTRGEAADIVDARFLWSGPCKDLDHQFWKDLGSYAKSQGLEWGGDWKSFKDVAHVELRRIEISQVMRGSIA